MLILTRRAGESIQIGEDITIIVLPSNGKQIKLGIQAPEYIRVLRSELVEEATDVAKLIQATKVSIPAHLVERAHDAAQMWPPLVHMPSTLTDDQLRSLMRIVADLGAFH